MSEDTSWIDTVSLPALLRAARNTYAAAIRAALADAECGDMPRNGVYVIGAIARAGVPLSQVIAELGVTKQAAGQLVDTLVLRGYLDRTVDADDRRRLTISLSERGLAAAAAARSAIERVDAEVLACVGPDCIAQARRALAVLAHAGHAERAAA